MIHYRLLRDNKETGPYSEEEMIAKGFKPYDLLWAEGKSAGWQYPSEIIAFKNHAPIVEEQPYDRFYKKQPAQKLFIEEDRSTSFTFQPQKAKEATPPLPVAVPPAHDYNLNDVPARHIHVTLPSGNTVNLTTLVAKKEVGLVTETASVKNIEQKKKVAAMENKSSQHSESSSNLTYAAPIVTTSTQSQHTPSEKRGSISPVNLPNRSDFSWTLILGAVIGIATLVGLGIMIGLAMNRDKNEVAFNKAMLEKTNSSAGSSRIISLSPSPTVLPAKNLVEPASQTRQQPALTTKNKYLVQNAVVKTVAAPYETKEEKKSPEKNGAEKIIPVQNNEEAVVRAKAAATTSIAMIEKNLSVTPNDFKTGAFGGISSLKCTLFNGSKSPLESVEVELDYIQANNKIYKTEKILFKDISAGAQATIDAPASSRGIKVISRIRKINTREGALVNTTAKS